jgi:hypothetical protein
LYMKSHLQALHLNLILHQNRALHLNLNSMLGFGAIGVSASKVLSARS